MTLQEHPAMHKLLQGLGWLALAAAFLLLSPGVTLTAKGESLASEFPAGPSCEAGSGDPDRLATRLSQQLETMRAQALAQADAAGVSGEGPVMLNNSGYNYRPTPRDATDEPATSR